MPPWIELGSYLYPIFYRFLGRAQTLLAQNPSVLMETRFDPLKTMDNYDEPNQKAVRTAKLRQIIDPHFSLFNFDVRGNTRVHSGESVAGARLAEKNDNKYKPAANYFHLQY